MIWWAPPVFQSSTSANGFCLRFQIKHIKRNEIRLSPFFWFRRHFWKCFGKPVADKRIHKPRYIKTQTVRGDHHFKYPSRPHVSRGRFGSLVKTKYFIPFLSLSIIFFFCSWNDIITWRCVVTVSGIVELWNVPRPHRSTAQQAKK